MEGGKTAQVQVQVQVHLFRKPLAHRQREGIWVIAGTA